MEIVAVFHDEIILRANEDPQFYWLGNNEQVLKQKSAGIVLIVSELVLPCYVKMVDKDIGKPCRLILK